MRKTKHVTKPSHYCSKMEQLKYLHVSYPAQAHSKKLFFTNDFNDAGIVLNKNNNANNVNSQINETRDAYNNIPTTQFTETKINPDKVDLNGKLLNYLMDIICGKRQISGCKIIEESDHTFMKLEISSVEGSDLIESTSVPSSNSNSETQTYESFIQKPEALVEERPIPICPPIIENNTNNIGTNLIKRPNVVKSQSRRQTNQISVKRTNQKSRKRYPKLKVKHEILKRRKRASPVKAKKIIRRVINPRTKMNFSKTPKIRLDHRNLKPGTYLLPKTTQEPKYESVSVEDKNPKNEPIMKFVPLQNFNTFDDKLTQLSTASSSDTNHFLTSKRSKNTDYEMTTPTI